MENVARIQLRIPQPVIPGETLVENIDSYPEREYIPSSSSFVQSWRDAQLTCSSLGSNIRLHLQRVS